jgi:hypothetical protein
MNWLKNLVRVMNSMEYSNLFAGFVTGVMLLLGWVLHYMTKD